MFVSSVLEIPNASKPAVSSIKLQKTLEKCYKKQLFVDTEIRIEDKIFRSHKCVLAFYSPIFQKAFYGNKISSSVCVINDVNPKGFETLLRYIYFSEIRTRADVNNLNDAFVTAKILGMIGIKDKLAHDIFQKHRFIKKSIAEEEFWSLLERSHLLKVEELKQILLIFAENHFHSVLNHTAFLKAGSQTIKLVLNLNHFSVPEGIILERIALWRDSNSNLELLDETVQDLLSCVHFESLSPKEFYSIVSKYNKLIPAKDALDILMHLVEPTATSLPEWCGFNNSSETDLLKATHSNPKTFYETDNFRVIEDLTKINNTKSIKGSESLQVFQAQKNLGKFEESQSVKDLRDGKSNIEAKSYTKTLSEGFLQMLDEGLFTDIILCDCNGVKIPAHRLILAARSKFFADLLYGPTSTSTLQLEETADELKWMLRNFYGTYEDIKNVIPVSFDEALRKLNLSLKYRYYPLMLDCLQAFNSTYVTQDNFWKLLSQVDRSENFKINTQQLMKYIAKFPTSVFTHDGFYSADESVLTYILKSDYLNISEGHKLEYVARWLEINSSKFDSYQSRKEILRYVKFAKLKAEQFFEFLKMHDDLIIKDDAFAILTCLFNDSKSSLPEWCHRGPPRNLYDTLTKIGSDVVIPWERNVMKGMKSFRSFYTAKMSNSQLECQIQFLELSWKVKLRRKGHHVNHKCNIIIKCDNLRDLIFNSIDVSQDHRIMVPIFLRLNSKKPTVQFEIQVNTKSYFKYHFIDQNMLMFENVVIESHSSIFIISDAVVDNYTSEMVRASKDLLPQNFNTVIPTKNFVKLIMHENV